MLASHAIPTDGLWASSRRGQGASRADRTFDCQRGLYSWLRVESRRGELSRGVRSGLAVPSRVSGWNKSPGAEVAIQAPEDPFRCGRNSIGRVPDTGSGGWRFETSRPHVWRLLRVGGWSSSLRLGLVDARPIPVRGLALRADSRAVWLRGHVPRHPLVVTPLAFPAIELDLHPVPPWRFCVFQRQLYTS